MREGKILIRKEEKGERCEKAGTPASGNEEEEKGVLLLKERRRRGSS